MILRDIRLARAADEVDLVDLTRSQRTAPAYWSAEEPDVLVMPLDPEPTEAEARKIRRRLVTADAADETHLGELLAAHADPQAPSWARLALASEIGRYGDPTTLSDERVQSATASPSPRLDVLKKPDATDV